MVGVDQRSCLQETGAKFVMGYYKMPRKAYEGGFAHVIAFTLLFRYAQNRKIFIFSNVYETQLLQKIEITLLKVL